MLISQYTKEIWYMIWQMRKLMMIFSAPMLGILCCNLKRVMTTDFKNNFAEVKHSNDFDDKYVELLHRKVILKFFYDKDRYFKDGKVNSIPFLENVQWQEIFEKELVGLGKTCKLNTSILSNIDRDILADKLQNDFYDPNFMEQMRCVINLILDANGEGGKLSERERIHAFFRDPKKFGADSVNGYAIRSQISDRHTKYTSDLIVMKCPQNPTKSSELVHEVSIGLTLNKLRKFIPNFSYVYDIFSCSSPVVDPNNKKIILWCTNDENAVAYAVYENISNSLPFKDWAVKPKTNTLNKDLITFTNFLPELKTQRNRKLESKEIKNISSEVNRLKVNESILYYLQIILALNLANEKCDFTHYDLHDDNVLIRHYRDTPFYIEYPFEEEKIYLLSPGGVATIIDYGMSHVQTSNNKDKTKHNVGILDKTGYFSVVDVYSDRSNVIGDAYKLLCFLMYRSLQDNNTLFFNIGRKILSFFYQKRDEPYKELSMDDALLIIYQQKEYYFYLPFVSEFELSLVLLTEHTLSVYKSEFPDYADRVILKEKPDISSLFGCDGKCPTKREIFDDIHFGITKIPTFFEVYDSKNNKNHSRMVANFIKNFEGSLSNEISELKEVVNFKLQPVYNFPHINNVAEVENFILTNRNFLVSGVDTVASLAANTVKLASHYNWIQYILTIQEIVEIPNINTSLIDLRERIQNLYISNKDMLNSIYPELEFGNRTMVELKLFITNDILTDISGRYMNVISTIIDIFKE